MSALADEIAAALAPLHDEIRALREELRATAARGGDALLDVDEAARRLGLARSTVYKLAQRCELPSVKAGARLLFRPADLDAHVDARRRSPERVKALAGPA
jgi:excisionase family DNA binding protein